MPRASRKQQSPRKPLPPGVAPLVAPLVAHVEHTLRLALDKAALHHLAPKRYPLPTEVKSLEHAAAGVLAAVPAPVRQGAIDRAVTRRDRSRADRVHELGPLAAVDLESVQPVRAQAHAAFQHARASLPHPPRPPLHMLHGKLHGGSAQGRLQLSPLARPVTVALPDPPGASGVHSDLDPIVAKYMALGGARGFLGPPRGQVTHGDGAMHCQYERGGIYWKQALGAHEVHGAIADRYNRLGAHGSFLGYPTSDERACPDGQGRFNEFEHGVIYWSPRTPACELHGAIYAKWAELGWETGRLGYPLTDETTTPDTIGRYNHFEGGSIYYHPLTGAHTVLTPLRDEWARLGWERGRLGYPLTDTSGGQDLCCDFQGGRLHVGPAPLVSIEWFIQKVSFRLTYVKCLDETAPEDCSSDDINMVATATDPTLTVSHSARFFVGTFERMGGARPDRVLHTFDLQRFPIWPKQFMVTTMLVEKDEGDLADALRQLYDASIEVIKDALVDLVREYFERYGEQHEYLDALIAWGYVWAYLGVEVFDAFFDAILNSITDLMSDDYFPPTPFFLVLPTAFFRWDGGSRQGPEEEWEVSAHGGKYRYRGRWELA